MLYWHMMERDDDHEPTPSELSTGPCWWCATVFTTGDEDCRFCCDACDLAWCAWSSGQVQPPEPLADGDTLPF
jgi:hypothetical protein